MGNTTVQNSKEVVEKNIFILNILKDIKAFEIMLERGLFEKGIERIGAEQELALVNDNWKPAPVNQEILDTLKDDHFTTELAKFNMEINLDPLEFKGNCLSVMESQLQSMINHIDDIGRQFGARPLLTGILPTIKKSDLIFENITPNPRYKILSDLLLEFRGGHFELHINGTDELITKHKNILFEACNTSFQVHLQVEADDFVSRYNWAQAISGPVLAAATNSPILLGKRLWRETRIALFQQSIDIRKTEKVIRDKSPRVLFGNSWVRNSIIELFQEDIARHKVIFTSPFEEDSLAQIEEGKIPKLKSLMLHNGSVYKWNRPCYGIMNGKPHLRIENRLFPSGPTIVDEIANMAFWLGLMKGMPKEYEDITTKMDFDDAKTNFLKAGRMGLGAQFTWIGHEKMIPSHELICKELLPIAREGLQNTDIDNADIDKYLNIIEERVGSQKTGSQWIVDSFTKLKKEVTIDEALVATTAGLYNRQKKGKPAHTWNLASLKEGGSWENRYRYIGQIMSTDLFTVSEEDLVSLVANIMDWRNFHQVPVENIKGELIGLISLDFLLHYYGTSFGEEDIGNVKIGDVMIRNPVTVKPKTKTIDALKVMRKKKLKCLPVTEERKLVGIVTEHDFVKICYALFEELEGAVS
jgi:CBS domain-containing protein/gamma-glutamylcysteine synthetase